MSQGITIKGKTAAGQNIEVAVDSNGYLITTPSGGSPGLTDAELRASAVPVSGTLALDATTLAALETINALVSGSVALDTATLVALENIIVTGTVALDAPTLAALENITAIVSGTVSVSNFPATQTVAGTVALDAGTLAALETISAIVSGSVSVSNFPASQAVTGAFFQATQPVSNASLPLPAGAATSAAQLPNNHNVVVTSAPTTPVTGQFFQTTQPTVDANKQAVIFYAQILTAGTTITPTAGKRIRLVKAQVLQSPDNTTANPVTLSFVSVGNFSTGWAYSDSCEATGAVNEVLSITLGNAQQVSVNIRYKEI